MLPNLPKRALDAEWDYWKEQWGSLSRLDDVSAWIAKLAEAWKRVDEEEEESAEDDETNQEETDEEWEARAAERKASKTKKKLNAEKVADPKLGD